MKKLMAKGLPEYKSIQFDSKEIVHGMKVLNQASISFEDDLVESLKGDPEAQLNFIDASIEDNYDSPTIILRALQIVANARGITEFSRESLGSDKDNLNEFFNLIKVLNLKILVVNN
jgi:DNA-binding phage protein